MKRKDSALSSALRSKELSKNAHRRLATMRANNWAFPRMVEVEPANIAKQARRKAGVTGSKASKAFRRAHRNIGVNA